MPQKFIDQTTIQPDGKPGDDAFTAFSTCNDNFHDAEQRFTALGERIDHEASDRGQQVAAESAIRKAADTALSQSIASTSARVPGDNYLINGEMQVWQRGNTFTWFEGRRYTADRWISWSGGGKQLFVEMRNMSNINVPPAMEQVRPQRAMYVEVGTGGTGGDAFGLLQQCVEGVHKLSGGDLTASMMVWVDKATKIGIGYWQNYDDGGNATVIAPTLIQLQPGWQFVQVTKTMPKMDTTRPLGNNNHITLNIWLASGDGGSAGAPGVGTEAFAMWISNIKLESGATATGYRPQRESDVLLQCQRYYEKTYLLSVVPGVASNFGRFAMSLAAAQGNYAVATPHYAVTKRATPAITLWAANGAPTAGTVAQDDGSSRPASVQNVGTSGFEVVWSNTAGHYGGWFHWIADAEI